MLHEAVLLVNGRSVVRIRSPAPSSARVSTLLPAQITCWVATLGHQPGVPPTARALQAPQQVVGLVPVASAMQRGHLAGPAGARLCCRGTVIPSVWSSRRLVS